jgi:hypothetical protein
VTLLLELVQDKIEQVIAGCVVWIVGRGSEEHVTILVVDSLGQLKKEFPPNLGAQHILHVQWDTIIKKKHIQLQSNSPESMKLYLACIRIFTVPRYSSPLHVLPR